MFINIHTHTENSNKQIIAVQNIMLHNQSYPENTENSYISAGVHPWYILQNKLDEQFDVLRNLADSKKIIAIGECGLDKKKGASFELQLQTFENQIKLAEEFHLPLIIHCIQSFNEIIYLRKKTSTSNPWIIHGFNKGTELAQQLIKLGFLLSYAVNSFPINEKLKNSIEACNPYSFFLETDTSENESIFDTYKLVADIKHMAVDELRLIQKNNFEKVFKRQLYGS